MKTIFALMALGIMACGPEKDDTGESPEADADTDSDSDTDGDTDQDTGCGDYEVPADWPELIDDADVHFAWGGTNLALGDVDGDGHDDIALDAALVLLGPFCPDDDPYDEDQIHADLSVSSGYAYQRMAGPGDVDGDGLTDFLVGDHAAYDDAGEVFLALSPVAGDVYLPDVAVADIVGVSERGFLGYAVAGVGDVDGDGVPDLLAGAYNDDGLGAAWLIPGTTRGYHAVSDVGVAIRGSEEYPMVGHNLAALGDTDGDGLSDFLIAMCTALVGSSVALVRGPVSADVSFQNADAVFLHHPDDEEYGGSFGMSISSAGDQDGDGLPDIAIGAPLSGVSGDYAGAVFVFQGTASGQISAAESRSIITGESRADDAGFAVDLAGDVNGDGREDLVIGVPGWNAGTNPHDVGAIYVVLGSVVEGTWSLTEADVRVEGTSDDEYHDLGNKIVGAGDTNGDGLDDILVAGWIEDGDDWLHSHLLLGRE
ncbi:MAG: integrin alpha [Pseudomonadota bacterium]